MSREYPTFDPNELPDEDTLHEQSEFELELIEQGASPDEIVEAKTIARKLFSQGISADEIVEAKIVSSEAQGRIKSEEPIVLDQELEDE